MLVLLQDDMREERLAYYGRLVRAVQMHDFHYPDLGGPPNPSQSCAQLQKGTLNMWHCKEGFPKDLVCEPCERSVAQDVHRPELWRCSLCRNCQLMNAHIPAGALGIQSNSDGSPVLTRNGSGMYCCKYSSKHSKRLGTRAVLCDVLDDMTQKDASAREAYGDTFEES